MAITVRNLIRSALRKISVLAAGEPVNPDDAADALDVLRQMIDAWATENLLIYSVNQVNKNTLIGERVYTIGTFADPAPDPLPDNHIDSPNIIQIMSAVIRENSETDYPLDSISYDKYNEVARKSDSQRPNAFYLQQGWPVSTIYLNAPPYEVGQLRLMVKQSLSSLIATASLNDPVALPPGYEQAIVYNLAMMLAPEYERPISVDIASMATMGKRNIKRLNYQSSTLGVDRALLVSDKQRAGTYIISAGP